MMLTLLRIGSVRFSAYYFVSLFTGLHLTGRDSTRWIILAAGASILGCLAIELLNRVTDETEDRINNPLRCLLCDRIGYKRLRSLSVTLFAVVSILGVIVWWKTSGSMAIFVLMCLTILIMYNYSASLRLKQYRWGVLVVLSLPFIFPFLLAWAAYGPLRAFPIAVLFLPLFAATISGAKDITDIAGDLQRNYHSVFVQLIGSPTQHKVRLLVLLLAPHVFLILLVALGLSPVRLLMLIGLLPLSFIYIVLCRHAQTTLQNAVMREWLYQLLFIAECATLFLIAPSARLAAVFAGAIVFWIIASRWLHWRAGLTSDHMFVAAGILKAGYRA